VAGVGPLNTLTTTFAGDWASFAGCGVACGRLAQCAQQLGENVQAGAYRLDGHWDGNAADAAMAYLADLASAAATPEHDLLA